MIERGWLNNYAVKDGVIVGYFGDRHSKTCLSIPSGANTIGGRILEKETIPKLVIIPEGISWLREGSLGGCKSVEEIRLPLSLRRIEKEAFSNDVCLNNVYIPSKVEYLGKEIFRNTKMKAINIPDGLEDYESGVLAGSGITRVIISSMCLWKLITLSTDQKHFFAGSFVEEFVIDDVLYDAEALCEEHDLPHNPRAEKIIRALFGSPFHSKLAAYYAVGAAPGPISIPV